jgi:Tol biopolymer transport system component
VRRRAQRILAAAIIAGLALVAAAPGRVGVRNGAIGFVNRGGIYTIRPDGSGVNKIAGGDPYGNVIYRAITWSPDGRRLAATDDRNLYVMRADGRSRRLLRRGGGGLGNVIAWSPRRAEIAVGQLIPQRIVIIRISDGRLRNVVAGAFPSWTPDGDSLVYMRQGHTSSGKPPVYDSVWKVRRDGSGNRRLATRAAMPALSPTGTMIAFVSEALYPDLRVMTIDGRNRRTLGNGSAKRDIIFQYPSWSPDGRFVLATRMVGSQTGNGCCESGLYVTSVTGVQQRIIHRQAEDLAAAWRPAPR